MSQQPDITVYSRDNRLQLVVEVKNKKGATIEWVKNMRRNLFAHSVVPYSPYFLLALPDYLYLWKHPNTTIDITPPDYTVNTRPIWEPYTNNSSHYLDTMSEYSLQMITNSWLHKLITANLTRENAKPEEGWLFDSGLYEAIRHGYIKTEATV